MATRSTIEWTQRTWNAIAGCTKLSPGCRNPNSQDPTAKQNGGTAKGGRLLDGRTWDEMPAVRQQAQPKDNRVASDQLWPKPADVHPMNESV